MAQSPPCFFQCKAEGYISHEDTAFVVNHMEFSREPLQSYLSGGNRRWRARQSRVHPWMPPDSTVIGTKIAKRKDGAGRRGCSNPAVGTRPTVFQLTPAVLSVSPSAAYRVTHPKSDFLSALVLTNTDPDREPVQAANTTMMGSAHKAVSVAFRMFELASAAVILGLLAKFFNLLFRINGPTDPRLVYAVSMACISIALACLLAPPLRYSFYAFPIDFALFVCWIVCFALLVDVSVQVLSDSPLPHNAGTWNADSLRYTAYRHKDLHFVVV